MLALTFPWFKHYAAELITNYGLPLDFMNAYSNNKHFRHRMQGNYIGNSSDATHVDQPTFSILLSVFIFLRL